MVELLKREVKILKIRKEILDKLNKNNIHTILELCNNSRIDLSKKDFIKEEINEIIITLQLLGLDLKKNHAKKNHIIEDIIQSKK